MATDATNADADAVIVAAPASVVIVADLMISPRRLDSDWRRRMDRQTREGLLYLLTPPSDARMMDVQGVARGVVGGGGGQKLTSPLTYAVSSEC